MQRFFRLHLVGLMLVVMVVFCSGAAGGQSMAGSISGTVTDPTGAMIPNATVTIQNSANGFFRTQKADSGGQYKVSNLPFGVYRLMVSAVGFETLTKVVQVNSVLPVAVPMAMAMANAAQTVTVEAPSDMVQNDSAFHTDIDRGTFEKMPLESESSGLTSLVTLSSPGVTADSNGLFHGMGDHASNSFSIDGQPITDQQSKVFSNELPTNSIESMSVIAGAPPAEYGGKTSLVIDVTTRSGEGVTTPTGSASTSYGSFGSSTGSFDLSYGGKNWGNFFEFDGLDTGRFLDAPEFSVFHAKGNEQNIFDRVDKQMTAKDAAQLNLNFSRSWFQTPNMYDNLQVRNVIADGGSANPVYGDVGNADQRSKIVTFDVAPSYTHTFDQYAVGTLGLYVRRDGYDYYGSDNPLADKGPVTLQNEAISQARSLLNAGVRGDVTYARGVNNIKLGGTYAQTFLNENDKLSVVNNTYNSPCMDVNGNPLPGYTAGACTGGGVLPNPNFIATLEPYDLTRGGGFYDFIGHTDVKELGLYLQDQIQTGNWLFNVGLRGDFYNGLARTRQAEPRVGGSYTVKRTATILQLSYARTLESPFNENLVLSSLGCGNAVLAPLLQCQPGVGTVLQPGFRNEFHAGFEQAVGRHFTLSGEYVWKYTHNAFDFSVLGNTPITFPIDWHNSKIPGYALHGSVPTVHGFSAFVVASSVAARFVGPQVAGAGATGGVTQGTAYYPFRIDHDEKFNENTHVQYQIPGKFSPWFSLNWHYDSGLVAGSTPCYNPASNDPNTACPNTSTLLNGLPAVALVDNNIAPTTNPVTGAPVYLPLTPDEEFEAGFSCNGVKASGNNQIGVQPVVGAGQPYVCLASQFASSQIRIPAMGTGDNDHNPPRVQGRSLFDVSVGDDNLLDGKRYKWSVMLTAINVANKYALYNFLSTFSGTHYVTPRAMTAQLAFHF